MKHILPVSTAIVEFRPNECQSVLSHLQQDIRSATVPKSTQPVGTDGGSFTNDLGGLRLKLQAQAPPCVPPGHGFSVFDPRDNCQVVSRKKIMFSLAFEPIKKKKNTKAEQKKEPMRWTRTCADSYAIKDPMYLPLLVALTSQLMPRYSGLTP